MRYKVNWISVKWTNLNATIVLYANEMCQQQMASGINETDNRIQSSETKNWYGNWDETAQEINKWSFVAFCHLLVNMLRFNVGTTRCRYAIHRLGNLKWKIIAQFRHMQQHPFNAIVSTAKCMWMTIAVIEILHSIATAWFFFLFFFLCIIVFIWTQTQSISNQFCANVT